MTTPAVVLQYVSPQSNTFAPLTQPNSLSAIVGKVKTLVLSRWTLVVAVGLITAFAVGIAPALLVTGIAALAASLLPALVKTKKLNIFTANMLGLFYDPFEFAGDYDPYINDVKRKLEALLIGKATQDQTSEQIAADLAYGPTLEELLPKKIQDNLLELCKFRGLNHKQFQKLLTLLMKHHKNDRLFYFLKNCPPTLLGIDKALREAAKAANKPFDLPIINSSAPIEGNSRAAQKKHLSDVLFTVENLNILKAADERDKNKSPIAEELAKDISNPRYPYIVGRAPAPSARPAPGDEEEAGPEVPAELAAGPEALVNTPVDPTLIRAFQSPEGRMLFYYLYQIMNIHLASDIMEEVNEAKRRFASGMGDPQKRAEILAKKIAAENADIVLIQECDRYLPPEMAKLGYFSTEKKLVTDPSDPSNTKWVLNSGDGSVIFFNSKTFKGAHVHPYDEALDPKHKNTVATAYFLGAERPIVVASCHVSDSNNKSFARVIRNVTQSTYQKGTHAAAVIGLDANPQSNEDEEDIRAFLQEENLQATKVGPTSIKMRLITLLHKKIHDLIRREKNMIVATGDGCKLENATVAFQKPPLDREIMMPNKNILSDQAPVGVQMTIKV